MLCGRDFFLSNLEIDKRPKSIHLLTPTFASFFFFFAEPVMQMSNLKLEDKPMNEPLDLKVNTSKHNFVSQNYFFFITEV